MALLVAARYGGPRSTSFRDLGRRVGLSWQRVQQVVNRGLRLLRHPDRRPAWEALLAARPELRHARLYRAVFPWRAYE